MTRWKSYEEVATYLLNQFAEHFGLERVEAKQDVVGLRSKTAYEIAKGCLTNDGGILSWNVADTLRLGRRRRKWDRSHIEYSILVLLVGSL